MLIENLIDKSGLSTAFTKIKEYLVSKFIKLEDLNSITEEIIEQVCDVLGGETEETIIDYINEVVGEKLDKLTVGEGLELTDNHLTITLEDLAKQSDLEEVIENQALDLAKITELQGKLNGHDLNQMEKDILDVTDLADTLNEGLGHVEEDLKTKYVKTSGGDITGDFSAYNIVAKENLTIYSNLIELINTVNDITKVPTSTRICVVNTSTGGTLGFNGSGKMTKGTELNIIINNTGSDTITITIPSSFKSNDISNIDIKKGQYGEINLIYDGTNYYCRAI